ncbi:LysR family transcriptional regulator [Mitsuaria sp. GD03876]|uniref:LysR family transcriptional regulator n=1 Tax=Mitsuaria sp. GD03876 TaxID=2975399 RepID=UPI00244851F2|nr:LysR family transcriptional regulator [Mitsuaria sp. GD03876]MDH0865572.1 LysR family transcriptional regulator [Mitsuaria sp. GD03876]
MDRLDAMAMLIAAVDAGSLSKASKRLGLPLATVSRKVADLERHLRATLLIRSAKGLELTDAGRSYVEAAKAILDQLNEAERAAAGEYTEPRGDLIVTAPTMFGRLHVLPTVSGFLAAFPDVAVDLKLTDRVAHFLDDQIDVALRIGELADSSLVATRLGEVRHVICAAPGYLAAQGVPASPDDLMRHRVVSFESVATGGAWPFRQDGQPRTGAFRSRLGVNTIDAALDAGRAGAGLVRALSYQVNEDVRAGRLQLVLEDFEAAPRPVHLVYAPQGRLPLKLRAFIDFAVPRLRERLLQAALPER